MKSRTNIEQENYIPNFLGEKMIKMRKKNAKDALRHINNTFCDSF